jgi:ADP-ribose pyrophosphatase YjhB (NUDIX family)
MPGSSPLSPDDRLYPARPILGVGALILRGSEILLIERGREPLKGLWSLPGGAVETGETLADAVRREVLEETGLEVETGAVVEIFERILSDDDGRARHHYVLIDYLCRAVGGDLRAGDDASQVQWIKREHLTSYSLTAGTLPVIEKAFREYLVV